MNEHWTNKSVTIGEIIVAACISIMVSFVLKFILRGGIDAQTAEQLIYQIITAASIVTVSLTMSQWN